MNVLDLCPRAPSDFDAIALEFFQDFPEPGVNYKRELTMPVVTLRDV